jgi:hypothetical protein
LDDLRCGFQLCSDSSDDFGSGGNIGMKRKIVGLLMLE